MESKATKMTSAVKKTSDVRSAGFTLLEMVVVLSISMLVVGGALSKLYFSRDEAKLTDAYQSIEVMAKRARTISTLQQIPYALEFKDKTVSLMPYAEATFGDYDRQDLLEGREVFSSFEDELDYGDQGADDGSSVQKPVRDSWVAEAEMMIFIKRWATSDWVPMTTRDRHVWRFDPSGICEPVAVRVEIDGSWVEVAFHPLTAAVSEMEFELR
jgi:prepilin-type N-terminal cleavage/methylation domain-containing protein